MKLEDYLSINNISKSDFAKSIQVTVQALYRYLAGRVPCPDVMARIKTRTNGAVTADSFY